MQRVAKPELRLVGQDGNAFAILGRAQHAARCAGWSKDEVEAMVAEATSTDYDHLLATMMDRFETS